MIRTVMLVTALGAALSACTLHDPKGRPPPGENFNASAGFGVASQPRATIDLSSAPRLFGKEDGALLTDGLTRLQRNGLLAGCDMLYATQDDRRRACKGGDLAFAEALEAGCTARHRDDRARLRDCLEPLAE